MGSMELDPMNRVNPTIDNIIMCNNLLVILLIPHTYLENNLTCCVMIGIYIMIPMIKQSVMGSVNGRIIDIILLITWSNLSSSRIHFKRKFIGGLSMKP